MLDVPRNGAVHIIIGAPFGHKRGSFIGVFSAEAHCPAVADTIVNAFNPKHPLIFTVWNQGRMKHDASVVQFFTFRKQEAQGICSRQNNFHS